MEEPDIPLRESQRRYRFLAEAMFHQIWTARPDGTLDYINSSVATYFGSSAERLLASGFGELVHPDDLERVTRLWREALATGQPYEVEHRLRRFDGAYRWHIGRARAYRDESGQIVKWFGSGFDVHDLKLAQQAAEEAARAKSTFLATMSHEIRTPMNAILGMAGLLAETALTDEQRDCTSTILSSGDHLLTVINDILDYSKLESEKLLLEAVPFTVQSVVEEAIDVVANAVREKGLELVYEIAPEIPRTIRSDPGRVRQVLVNYLSNAIKFTDSGEVVITVRPGADAEIHFAVRDSGIGVAPERLERLFQSFSQVDAAITRKYGGSGLGLAICKRLCELMGGRVWVDSTVDLGSTFHFTISAQPSEPGNARPEVLGALQGRRVWLIDDHATTLRILSRQLEAWGTLPRATDSCQELLAWARSKDERDVAIVDAHMPERVGLALASELHQIDPHLPIILMGASSMVRPATAARHGVVAQLAKPLKHVQLLHTLTRLFDSARGVPAEVPVGLPADLAQRAPLRILVAEDNRVNSRLIVLVLAKLGYRADVAGNGREVLEALGRQRYDLVLMDVQMPELDGIEATRRIMTDWSPSQRPRVVALTAGVLPDERELCLEAGMQDFLMKPISPAQLIDVIQRTYASIEPGPATLLDTFVASSRRAPSSDKPFESGFDRARDFSSADVVEMVEAFERSAQEQVRLVRTALFSAEAPGAAAAANGAKAQCMMMGAIGMAKVCVAIARHARAGEIGPARDLLLELESQYEAALRALAEARGRV